jgi:acyl-coenzyme A synthetase/AMP-(fatty) acid ligase
MLRNNSKSLSGSILAADHLSARVAVGSQPAVAWKELADGLVFGARSVGLSGRCVVLATTDQLLAAAALVELDGLASRIVLCPPDISRENLTFTADCAAADVIVTDQVVLETVDSRVQVVALGKRDASTNNVDSGPHRPSVQVETEWVLLTSGTTGRPKLVVHTFASLAGAIDRSVNNGSRVVWGTFYDIRRYGGLQIFLRAALTGASLLLRGAEESVADFLVRAGAAGVTHISGTPSQWRHALMNLAAPEIAPEYVRLSGEIADQAILNQVRDNYPTAKIAHAFASTEAGVAFAVNDGLMGFPSELLAQSPDVEMKVEDLTLRVRSARTASRYLNKGSNPIRDFDGFVDTGDALELRDGRYYFVGRRDGTVNVGGLKVHPEEVEAVLNRHPQVSISLVRTKKSRITGSLVVADVVLRSQSLPESSATSELQSDILQFCREELARHKVPIAINFVPALAVAESGKLVRPLA